MTKPRNILKGKVKRLLREQEDMGQLCDPAVQYCVSALEAFVHDLGRRLTAQAEKAGVETITPVELKRSALESADLAFLHEKVAAIDESDVKYHKPSRKRKAPTAAPDGGTTKKKSGTSVVVAATAAAAKRSSPAAANAGAQKNQTASAAKTSTPDAFSSVPRAAAVPAAVAAATAAVTTAIDEDDNYDSSDSD